jgi:Sec-independent protein secretion pathway component TatC
MKTAAWLALITIIYIIAFNTIISPNEVMSQYGVLLALCLSLYTGIFIRD